MTIYRVMICDAFVNVEASGEDDAKEKVVEHLSKHPPGDEKTIISLIAWEASDETEVDI